jgi:IclR family acetate operon transcriptional repressor
VTQQARLPKSSAFRILQTLEIAGYLQRIDGDRFILTPCATMIPDRRVSRVVEAARPWMRRLSQEFSETVSLALLFDNHVEVAAVIESPQRVHMGNIVGGLIPPNASSLGKCITAYQSEERREKLLRSFGVLRFTPNTIVNEVELHKEFELVRERGYATDIEESTLGGCCLSSPIFGEGGDVIAAVSVSMPKMRFTNQDRLVAAVRDAAEAITLRLQS